MEYTHTFVCMYILHSQTHCALILVKLAVLFVISYSVLHLFLPKYSRNIFERLIGKGAGPMYHQ